MIYEIAIQGGVYMEVFKQSIIEDLLISNYGVVKRISDDKILAVHTDACGYKVVRDGKVSQYKIHRMVAEAFCEKFEDCNCVCHKNDVKADNRSDNLYWGTYSDNNKDRFANLKDSNVGKENPRFIESDVFYDYPYTFKKKLAVRNMKMEEFNCEKHELVINKCGKQRWKYKYTLKIENETN